MQIFQTYGGGGGGGPVAFTDLTDVDGDYTGDALKYVRVNAGETGLEFTSGMSGTFLTLTDALTNLFEIALPAGGMAGGEIIATIRASDGTDHQVLTQRIVFAAVNKAGTYTTALNVDVGNELTVVTSGTLTATWAVTNGSNKITIGVTPAGSLTESTYNIYFQVVNNSPHVVTYL